MGYHTALAAAGAVILDFERFGDWEGTWIAEVSLNGARGFVVGSYGSCELCDAFEAEFCYSYEDELDYDKRLKKFGESYLKHILTLDEMKKDFCGDVDDWDMESSAIKQWLESKRDDKP